MSLKLYTSPGNPRAAKARIAAAYNKVELEVVDINLGTDNKTPEYLAKFPLGKVPALETPEGNVWESNAIARYVARLDAAAGLYGRSPIEGAQVDQWLDWVRHDLEIPASVWLYPIYGIIPDNAEATRSAKGDIRQALNFLNEHLKTRSFLVGERLTLADIVVAETLVPLYSKVVDGGFRKAFVNVNRWLTTCVNQPAFLQVQGPVEFCEKMAQAPKAAPAKKEQPKKEQPKKEQPKKEQPKKEEAAPKKGRNPLELLPKSSFVLDEWKRVYSNENDTRKACAWLWDNIDREGWSVWLANYNYPEDNTKIFMTCNLVGGFIQRLESLRKWGFASFGIFGEDGGPIEIIGAFLVRGLQVPEELSGCPDSDSYTFTKVDLSDDAQRTVVDDLFCWEGAFGGKDKKFAQGKVFK